jgi:hypothetical protein
MASSLQPLRPSPISAARDERRDCTNHSLALQRHRFGTRGAAEGASPRHLAPGRHGFGGHNPDASPRPVARRKGVDRGDWLMADGTPVPPDGASADTLPPRPNRTGLPDHLKAGVEALSGVSLDAVRVHYNSPEPAQVNARAYTQGNDIHVGPGQQRHLAHEAWHAVQQAQRRVLPTMRLDRGPLANDDAGLEREADTMGARAHAIQPGADRPVPRPRGGGADTAVTDRTTDATGQSPVQRMVEKREGGWYSSKADRTFETKSEADDIERRLTSAGITLKKKGIRQTTFYHAGDAPDRLFSLAGQVPVAKPQEGQVPEAKPQEWQRPKGQPLWYSRLIDAYFTTPEAALIAVDKEKRKRSKKHEETLQQLRKRRLDARRKRFGVSEATASAFLTDETGKPRQQLPVKTQAGKVEQFPFVILTPENAKTTMEATLRERWTNPDFHGVAVKNRNRYYLVEKGTDVGVVELLLTHEEQPESAEERKGKEAEGEAAASEEEREGRAEKRAEGSRARGRTFARAGKARPYRDLAAPLDDFVKVTVDRLIGGSEQGEKEEREKEAKKVKEKEEKEENEDNDEAKKLREESVDRKPVETAVRRRIGRDIVRLSRARPPKNILHYDDDTLATLSEVAMVQRTDKGRKREATRAINEAFVAGEVSFKRKFGDEAAYVGAQRKSVHGIGGVQALAREAEERKRANPDVGGKRYRGERQRRSQAPDPAPARCAASNDKRHIAAENTRVEQSAGRRSC